MSKKDEYLIDYEKLYPGVDIPPEVLEVLKKSDRKMMYLELDLKSEHYINKEGQEIVLPSRERSLELMFEDDSVQFASDDESTEDQAIQRIRCSSLHEALTKLEAEELALVKALYFWNMGEREYRRVTWSRNGVKRIVWRCISRLDYGKKYCKDSPTVFEDKLKEAIVRAVNKFNDQDNATYKALMRATIGEALGLNADPEEVDMLERKIEALNSKMLALVNESVASGEGIEAHESEFMSLSQEAELLKQRIATIQESAAADSDEQDRLEQIQAIIAEREHNRTEYDDAIVRQMIECIKVYPGGKLEIIFGGGYLVEETV